jgi:hypothetical protein
LLLDKGTGFLAMRIRMGFASTAAVGNPYVFNWDDDSSDGFSLFFNPTYDYFNFRRLMDGIGVGEVNTGPRVFSVDSEITLVAAWTPTELKISYAGEPFTVVANTAIPMVGQTLFDIGADSSGGNQASADVIWVLAGKGQPLDADVNTLAALGNTDPTLSTLPARALPTLAWAALTASASMAST